MTVQQKFREIQMQTEVFQPVEAKEFFGTLFDTLSNMYKKQFLVKWEGDHSIGLDYLKKKLNKLEEEKQRLDEMIDSAQHEGRDINFRGLFEIISD